MSEGPGLDAAEGILGDMLPTLVGVPADPGRLRTVAKLIYDLSGSYSSFGIRRWFGRVRPQLAGRAPTDILVGDWDPDAPDVMLVRELASSLTHHSASLRGPITVSGLMVRLAKMDPDALVVVPGYEQGVDVVDLVDLVNIELDPVRDTTGGWAVTVGEGPDALDFEGVYRVAPTGDPAVLIASNRHARHVNE